jgi:molybdopterin-guanine dinucleotide biosynthesis protein A
MLVNASALILAGGESRRMGQDKAQMLFNERPLLQSMISIMQPLFVEVMISVRQPRPEITLPQVCDVAAQHGPLAGLVSGLERVKTPWLFAVACDMPFVTPAVISYLAQQRTNAQVVVPMVQGYAQPLCAFYAANCLVPARDCLYANGKHSLRALLEKLQVCYVSEDELKTVDPTLRSFFDLDTPQDLAAAMNEGYR